MKIEEQITEYQDVLYLMARKVRQMMQDALKAMVDGNKDLALSVIEQDDYVNMLDQDISQRAIEILSLLQPVASDLRVILGGIRISGDFERIGDYAKSIAKYTLRYGMDHHEIADEIMQMGNIFLNNFTVAIEALREKNLDKAFEAPALDQKLDEAFARLFTELDEKNRSAQLTVPFSVISVMRNIERAGDHTKNICEGIIYMIKGQTIDFG